MRNVFDVLKERGFIEQATHEEEIRELLGKEKVTFYIGFDPTADSLHVGHFIQVMVMMHMQQAGHRPIALLGGGTGLVGDPSGRTDLRQMLTMEQIEINLDAFRKQFSKHVDFSEGKAIMVNNGDWLTKLNYIEFLRDIGKHFSVNRMLSFECFKSRMEKGLSFLEFNYMIMQSYDFLVLYRDYGCKLQLGGNDQWSNIIGGVELVRKVDQGEVFGLTFKLLATSEGKKMGKTEQGALWLDPDKTSPYDFYQYWRNVNDADVHNCLSLLTFIPMEEVDRLASLEGAEINEAKKILAFEVTKLIHGEEEAVKAKGAAEALFEKGENMADVPSVMISSERFKEELHLLDILVEVDFIKSKSEGRRLVEQNGLSLNEEKVKEVNTLLEEKDFTDGNAMVKKGKKDYLQLKLN